MTEDEEEHLEDCHQCQYDYDLLIGKAHCVVCGHSWWLSSEQLSKRLALEAQWYEEEYDRRQKVGPDD